MLYSTSHRSTHIAIFIENKITQVAKNGIHLDTEVGWKKEKALGFSAAREAPPSLGLPAQPETESEWCSVGLAALCKPSDRTPKFCLSRLQSGWRSQVSFVVPFICC